MEAHLPAGIVEAAEIHRRDIGFEGGERNEPNPSPDGGIRPTPSDEDDAAKQCVYRSAWEL
jgi:hypothetical protein